MTFRRPKLRGVFIVMALAGVMALDGCGDGGHQPPSGTVMLDGAPLPEGQIAFSPRAGTSGPTAGAAIRDGAFSVANVPETFVGSFRVEITASRPTGRKIRGPSGESIDEMANDLPQRYNTASELVAEVTTEGPNVFEFTLQSK